MKKIFPITIIFLLLFSHLQVQSWGFWGHKRINRIAVFTLPPEMLTFYKENIDFITEHAVDPDKRRYAISAEAPRHYIDLEFYDTPPFKNIPRYWNDAIAHYGEDTLNAHGIVPWYVNGMFYRLVNAFKEKNKARILHLSADIGHYISDAHVPLHCTHNYNGQFTNQVGIHGFWESRIPELFGDDYDFFVGKAEQIESPNDFIWKIIEGSALEVDSVLNLEKLLSQNYPSDKKFGYEMRGASSVKVYSKDYSKRYSAILEGMIERKMRDAIIAVGSFWYSAWVYAGKPDLNNLKDEPLTIEEQQELNLLDKNWKTGKIIGREHNE